MYPLKMLFVIFFLLQTNPTNAWSAYDKNCSYKKGLVETVYRSMSHAVPHKDLFYPSCSRVIRDEFRKHGLLGLISGFGRWAKAHMFNKNYIEVVVNNEIRLFDPQYSKNDIYDWSGFDALPTDCSEVSGRVVKFIPFVGVLPETW